MFKRYTWKCLIDFASVIIVLISVKLSKRESWHRRTTATPTRLERYVLCYSIIHTHIYLYIYLYIFISISIYIYMFVCK